MAGINDQILEQLLQNAGPSALPSVAKSAYLQQALEQINQSGVQSKTPGALVANLGAEALTRLAQNRQMTKLSAQYQQNIQDQARMWSAGLGGSDASGAPSAPTGSPQGGPPPPMPPSAPAGAPSPAPAPMAPAPPQQPPAGAPPNPQAQMLAALIKGGVPSMGAAGLVGNMAQESGPNLSQANPSEGAVGAGNWEGPRAQAFNQFIQQHGGSPSIDNQAGFTLSELNGPEAKAMAALKGAQNPQAAAAAGLAYERPAGWTPNGNPANASGWQNRLAMAQQLAGGQPTAPPPMPAAMQGNPGAYQTASNGPPPPPPSQGAPMPPQGGPQAPGPQGAPQHAYPPTGLPGTPQQVQLIQSMLTSPFQQIRQQGMQAAMQLRMQMATPLAPPDKMMWGRDGRLHPMPGMETRQIGSSAPGEMNQQDAMGQITPTAIPNAVQNGQVFNPGSGGYQPIPGLQPTTSGSMLPGTVTSQTPGNAPTVVQSPSFDPEKVRQAFAGSPQVQQYATIHRVAEGFANALVNAAGKNNGILGTTGVDAVIQSYGLNPRAASAKDLATSMGLSEDIGKKVNEIFGAGGATVDGLKQMFSVIQSEDQAARTSAERLQQSDTAAGGPAYAKGVPGESQLLPPPIQTPSFGAFGGQPASPANNPSAILQDARQAILRGAPRAQVMQRLQSMGINAGAL